MFATLLAQGLTPDELHDQVGDARLDGGEEGLEGEGKGAREPQHGVHDATGGAAAAAAAAGHFAAQPARRLAEGGPGDGAVRHALLPHEAGEAPLPGEGPGGGAWNSW